MAETYDEVLRERNSLRSKSATLREQLAASQLEAQRLREALESFDGVGASPEWRNMQKEALSLPSDLSALREHEARVIGEMIQRVKGSGFESAKEALWALELLAQQKRDGSDG